MPPTTSHPSSMALRMSSRPPGQASTPSWGNAMSSRTTTSRTSSRRSRRPCSGVLLGTQTATRLRLQWSPPPVRWPEHSGDASNCGADEREAGSPMSVTVRDVLSLAIVQAGEPEVVAGEANLDRPIRWVHIADVIDVAPLLKGSELLLTSGLELSHSPERHQAYVRDLAAAGVAGVFMSLGWAYHRPPQTLVEEARRCELPLVLLHRAIPFVEVTEEVHTAILNRQFALIQKADRIGRS